MIKDLVHKNRSYRRFDQSFAIERQVLLELVALARLSPSASNRQPLKYLLSCDGKTNDLIFRHLAWAGYLTDWPGPAQGRQPSAYIIILNDTHISEQYECDHGIAAQSILLGAVERGLGGCIVGSIDRAPLVESLGLPEHLKILLAIALGKPAEKVVIEDIGPSGSIKYYRDPNDIHHVPKRSLDELII